jgi:hypothetical protein
MSMSVWSKKKKEEMKKLSKHTHTHNHTPNNLIAFTEAIHVGSKTEDQR